MDDLNFVELEVWFWFSVEWNLQLQKLWVFCYMYHQYCKELSADVAGKLWNSEALCDCFAADFDFLRDFRSNLENGSHIKITLRL